MNANELADELTNSCSTSCCFHVNRETNSTEALDLIRVALRQYAALEWLWEQVGSGWTPLAQRQYRGCGFLAKANGETAYGDTPTLAINNLRAKLEPPHEHVWGKWHESISVGDYYRTCQTIQCAEEQRAERLVPA